MWYQKLKTKYMTTAVITKTLEKISNEPKEYSLGFRRWVCLPKRVKRDIYINCCFLRGENNIDSMKKFLNDLTEQEFINWMKLA